MSRYHLRRDWFARLTRHGVADGPKLVITTPYLAFWSQRVAQSGLTRRRREISLIPTCGATAVTTAPNSCPQPFMRERLVGHYGIYGVPAQARGQGPVIRHADAYTADRPFGEPLPATGWTLRHLRRPRSGTWPGREGLRRCRLSAAPAATQPSPSLLASRAWKGARGVRLSR